MKALPHPADLQISWGARAVPKILEQLGWAVVQSPCPAALAPLEMSLTGIMVGAGVPWAGSVSTPEASGLQPGARQGPRRLRVLRCPHACGHPHSSRDHPPTAPLLQLCCWVCPLLLLSHPFLRNRGREEPRCRGGQRDLQVGEEGWDC